MSETQPEQTSEQIPGQEEIPLTDESPDPTLTREGDAPSTDPGNESSSPTGDDSDTTPEPDPTPASDPDALPSLPETSGSSETHGIAIPARKPEVHRFRLVHEIAADIESVAHTVKTSEPMVLADLVEAVKVLGELGL